MNLLNKLTIKNLKLNKKRTIVTVIGIMLSVALITAVSTMYSSALASLIDFEIYEKGNFHVAFYEVDKTELKTFRNNRSIDNIYLTKDVGYARLNDSQNEYKPYVFIKAFTKDALQNLSVKLTNGRLPQNENEIVIPTHLKTNGRVVMNIGDTITLDVGTRVSEGQTLNQNNPYSQDNQEEIINTTRKTYKIVGIIERPASNIENYEAPGYTFITYIDENKLNGNVDLYARFTKNGVKNSYETIANILGVDAKLFKKVNNHEETSTQELEEYLKQMDKSKYSNNNINSYLIALETNPISNSGVGGLGVVVVIVIGIIVFTSVFCIKNSFDISITEKIKQYGMLRSIGATKKQIKKNVFYEATILGLIGIPLGILSGLIASYILIIVSNHFMNGMLSTNLKLRFSISIIAILASTLLGILTIYLSAIRSARRASKVTPIDSIRNSANIKINSKKLKSPKIIHKLFGIGGEISYKNIKRNKKKYLTTIISLIVSVSIFIALYSFMNLAFITIEIELSMQEYNVDLSMPIGNKENLYTKALDTTKLENIEEYTVYRNSGFNIENAKYNKEYQEKLNEPDNSDFYDGYINVSVVGYEQYQKYIKNLGLNYNKIKEKGILIDTQKIGIYNEKTKKTKNYNIRQFSYNIGDKISGKLDNDNEFEIEIAHITSALPFGIENYSNSTIIISDELYDKIIKNNMYVHIYYNASNADKLQDDIDELLKGEDYYINNAEENTKMMKNLYTLIGIFLYGFIIVISLIGITNIFNTITTNMELRRQEFAMLKSIGMTKKEFTKMIRLESIFMGTKSLLFGIPIGLALSYLIYHFLSSEDAYPYPFPLMAIIISISAVFLLITCIMKYEVGKINKQNTIETIRNENI